MFTQDPKTLALLFLTGVVPALLWLWFWRREDKANPEPRGLVALVFIMGMITVLITLPVQKVIQGLDLPHKWELTAWASAEEILKFLLAYLVVAKTRQADQPTDWPIYLIAVAAGFAALENVLFLLKPFVLGDTAVGLLTGHLRFLGSTLLHTVTSGIVGVSMGLSFYMGGFGRKLYILIGIGLAVALHSIFNFFIIQHGGSDFLKVFSFLWVAAIIIFLLFEKLRRMDLAMPVVPGPNQ